jgi:secreted trypsin-like serine protease
MLTRHLFPALGLAAALALPAAARTAETNDDAATDPALSSPFAFAESRAKAARRSEAEATADASGSRVIGGAVAEPGAWPWQVALMIAGRDRSPDSQFCGGTMILDTWVLTAAHCIRQTDSEGRAFDVDPAKINVLVGAHLLSGTEGDLVPADLIIAHPGYDPGQFDNDIALIRLARAPEAAYRTIQVPDAGLGDRIDQEGVPTWVTGWGLIEGAEAPDAMREARIQILDRDACNGALMEARARAAVQSFAKAAQVLSMDESSAREVWSQLLDRAPRPMTANMLCSGTYEGGRTSCQGDSGGPLVVPLEDGGFVQAGIVSWGLSAGPGKTCAETAMFSAYTRVSNYLPWLEQTIDANP